MHSMLKNKINISKRQKYNDYRNPMLINSQRLQVICFQDKKFNQKLPNGPTYERRMGKQCHTYVYI